MKIFKEPNNEAVLYIIREQDNRYIRDNNYVALHDLASYNLYYLTATLIRVNNKNKFLYFEFSNNGIYENH